MCVYVYRALGVCRSVVVKEEGERHGVHNKEKE